MNLELSHELTIEAHSLSMEAHKKSPKPYITTNQKHTVIIAFSGSWELKDWFHDQHFGETYVDPKMFPSLRFIGQDKLAKVNRAFFERFQKLLTEARFEEEVRKAVEEDKKKIVLTGHSSGGAIASLATIWILEKYKEFTRKKEIQIPVSCITFGSPLVGDRIVSHAIRREKWADRFINFVTEHDIVPRIMLAPHSSIQEQLPSVLSFCQQKVNPVETSGHKPSKFLTFLNIFTQKRNANHDHNGDDHLDQSMKDQLVAFFENVLMSASTVASHVAYDLMEPTGSLMEKLTADFVKVSPYRPFGTYIFCTRNERQDAETTQPYLVVENPNAALQLLYYFCQLSSEDQSLDEFAVDSLTSSISYEEELNKNGFQDQNLVNLKDLNDSLSDGTPGDEIRTRNKALSELSTKGRLCLMAAEEAEKRKKANEKRIDESLERKEKNIKRLLEETRKYKRKHAAGITGYYDMFKLQDESMDFDNNINRLELMKIWDEIIEMVIREDLPDEFECRKEWVDIGTHFRRLVEPLDIANYYRHSKGENYFKFRPKRYKFTQRWHEHDNRLEFGLISESNFMAEVEDLKGKEFDEKRVLSLENQVFKWVFKEEVLDRDVFLKESTFSKWWSGLPVSHQVRSVLRPHIAIA